jgi:hypothetical protein
MKMAAMLLTGCLIILASAGCFRFPKKPTASTTQTTSPSSGSFDPILGPIQAGRKAGQRLVTRVELEQISKLYITYWLDNPRGPSKVEDFDLERLGDRKLSKLIKDGELVVVWNVSENNTNCQILAYDKNVPTEGGFAARRDGSVNSMTPAEFKEYQKTFPAQK